MKVLVLDLEEDILDLLDYNLSKAGFEVLGLSEEEDAFKLAVAYGPQAVLIGNCSSQAKQREICHQMRELDQLGDKPVLIIGLTTDADYCELCSQVAEVDLCLVTPIKPKELIQTVRKHLALLQPIF